MPMPTRTHHSRRHLVRPPSKQILQLREDGDFVSSPFPSTSSSSSWRNTTDGATQHLDGPAERNSGEEDDGCSGVGGGGNTVAGSSSIGDAAVRRVHTTQRSHEHASLRDTTDGASIHTSNQHDGAGGDAADASSTRRRIQHTTQRAMTASAARRGGHSAHRGRKEGGGSSSSSSHRLHQRRSSSNTGEFSHDAPYAYGAAPAVPGGHVTYYGSPSNRLPPATASVSPAASPSSSLSVTDKSALHAASSNGSSRELLTAAHSERRLSTFTSSGTGGGGDGGRRSGVSVVSHSSPSSGEMSCGDAGTAPPTPPGANTFSTEAPGDFEPCRRSDTTPTHGRGSARTTPSDAVKATIPGGGGGGGGFGTRDGSPASTRGFSGLVTAANALHRASPASLAPDHTSASSISMTNNNSTAALGTFPRHADTPLTYAAVASTPSSTAGSSSLHGKRLPQSRVGFGNYRKRASTASVSSTVCSTIGTPATAGTPLFLNEAASGSSLAGGRHGGVGGGGGSSSAAVDGVWGFPSVPLTPRTVTTASGSNRTAATTRTTTTTTSNTSRATAPNSPPSPAPLIMTNDDGAEERVAGGGGDKDVEREGEDGGDRRGWSAGDTVDVQEGCQSMPSARRPPIPHSLHRHQPTNFFLQLPPGHGQQPDSDEEDGCCCGGGGGDGGGQAEGGEGRQRSSSNLTTTAAVNGMMAASTQPQQQQSPRSPAPLSPTAQRQQSAIIEEELRRCHTSSTHAHTGPAVAAKAAAGLQLQPLKMSFDGSIASPAVAEASAASSAIQTPAAPTVQRPSPQPQQASSLSFTAQQQQQTAAASVKSVAAMQAALSCNDDEIGEATPTGPAPPTMANVRVGASSRGGQLPKSNSTACFFNAVEIIPGLFLGAYSDATDTEVLAAHGISLVVNCSLECPVTPAMAHNAHHVRYVQCPLRDHSDEAIAPFFPAVTQIIHEQLHRRQINQQRVQRRHSTAAATTPAARLLTTLPAATAAAPPHQQLQLSGRRNSTGEEESGAGESLQDGMVWTWADEAENVWAVPPSPASPPLSVGGQPSLKEGKRETPRTPSSALGCWVRGSDGSASGCTSGSPSPLPGRATTFPKTAAPNAAMDAVPAKAGFGSSYSTTTMHNNSNASNTSNNAAAGVVVNAVTPATTALTVVDPRDCGGVLVHCRMGVSRSATFVMAYLILYGYTLATLEDTASLFVGFLERERCIIEEAGGRARFSLEGSDASGNASCGGGVKTATTTAAATAAPATSATSLAGLRTPNNNNSSSNNNTSATAASVFGQSGGRVGARVGSPTSTAPTASQNGAPTPNSSPLGVRGLLNGFASWYQQRSTSNYNNNNASTVSGGSTTSGVGSSSSCYGSPLAASQRRSNAVPVGSPLFLGVGATTASPRSVSSASHQRLYSLQTPLETCSRVCRACHLQRLRERRLQQQARLGLLLNSHLHHPHHQHRQVLQTQAEKDEEEEQRMALAAVARGRAAQAGALQGDRSAFGGDVATTEDGRTLRFVGAEEFDEDGNEEENDNNDDNVDDNDAEEEDREEEEGRPLSSSAPVMSYRSARSGTYDFGRRSLLQAARIADDEVYKGEMEEDDDGPLNGGSLEDDTQRLETPTAAMASNNETPPPPPPASSSTAAGGGDSVQPWRNSFSVSKTSASATAAAVPLAAQGDSLAGPRGLETLTPAEVASVVAAGGRSGRQGGGFGLNGCCDNSSMTSSHSVLSADLAPAMTFREAFDAVKKEKSDVNPNIGFVLALRELAGGGDFSFSTSL